MTHYARTYAKKHALARRLLLEDAPGNAEAREAWHRALTRLYDRRTELGYSQASVAMQLDRVQSWVCDAESGRTPLSALLFIKWCHFLDLDPADVLL